jgi:hypothetical protein
MPAPEAFESNIKRARESVGKRTYDALTFKGAKGDQELRYFDITDIRPIRHLSPNPAHLRKIASSLSSIARPKEDAVKHISVPFGLLAPLSG